MIRRCSWASSNASTLSSALVCMSSHGEISDNGRSNSTASRTAIAQSVCIQVVPHFGGVLMTMSSARNGKPSQRALSNTTLVYRFNSASRRVSRCLVHPVRPAPGRSPGSAIPAPSSAPRPPLGRCFAPRSAQRAAVSMARRDHPRVTSARCAGGVRYAGGRSSSCARTDVVPEVVVLNDFADLHAHDLRSSQLHRLVRRRRLAAVRHDERATAYAQDCLPSSWLRKSWPVWGDPVALAGEQTSGHIKRDSIRRAGRV